MFSESHFDSLHGHQGLAYLSRYMGFSRKEVAEILRESEPAIVHVLATGNAPGAVEDRSSMEYKCNTLLVLLHKVRRLAEAGNMTPQQLLSDRHAFKSCIVLPPWYEAQYSPREYLINGGMIAVEASIRWINKY